MGMCRSCVSLLCTIFLLPQAESWDRNYKETGPLDDYSVCEHNLFFNLKSKPKPSVGESSDYVQMCELSVSTLNFGCTFYQ